MLVRDHFAGVVRVTGRSGGEVVELCVYILLNEILHQKVTYIVINDMVALILHPIVPYHYLYVNNTL